MSPPHSQIEIAAMNAIVSIAKNLADLVETLMKNKALDRSAVQGLIDAMEQQKAIITQHTEMIDELSNTLVNMHITLNEAGSFEPKLEPLDEQAGDEYARDFERQMSLKYCSTPHECRRSLTKECADGCVGWHEPDPHKGETI